jgi:hypothetical protein
MSDTVGRDRLLMRGTRFLTSIRPAADGVLAVSADAGLDAFIREARQGRIFEREPRVT